MSGNARIEDHACVTGGQISEDAQLGALTVVDGGQIRGSARIATVMNAIDQFGNLTSSGSVQLLGDMELRTSLSSGVFYGIVDAAQGADPAFGANRTEPVVEVTASGPYTWRP